MVSKQEQGSGGRERRKEEETLWGMNWDGKGTTGDEAGSTGTVRSKVRASYQSADIKQHPDSKLQAAACCHHGCLVAAKEGERPACCQSPTERNPFSFASPEEVLIQSLGLYSISLPLASSITGRVHFIAKWAFEGV